jgi:hypothetical protein
MGVNVMRPAFNLEPKYRVTMLTREEWTRGSGPPPEIKGLVWYTDGSRMKEGSGAGVYGQSVKGRLSFSLGRYTTVFQAEIYAILACVHEIQFQKRPEKYVSTCSDSQAALKALQAIRTMSLDMPEYVVMRSLMGSQGMALLWDFLDPSRPWGSLDVI